MTFPRKINVMHLVETLGVGGMENGLVNLANHFDYEHFGFALCCFRTVGPMTQRIVHPNAGLYELATPPGINLSSIFPIAELLRRTKTDILHTHGWGSRSLLGFFAAKLAGIPYCINGEHGVLHIKKKHQLFLQKWLARRFDGTLSVSTTLKEKLVKQLDIPLDDITVIPNGVDTEKFNGNYPRSQKRQELGLAPDAWVATVIASLKLQKNQEVVIRAVARLREEGVSAKLVIVGSGPDQQRLADLAVHERVSEDVLFLGNRDDIPQLLAAVDAVIVSSIPDHEGMSNILLEAMSSGVPAFSTESVGARELIQEGETGFLFSHDDPDELASKLAVLCHAPDLRRRIAETAQRFVRTSYSIAAMVEGYQNYYISLMQSGK